MNRYPDVEEDAFKAFVHYVYVDELNESLVEECAVQTLILSCRFQVIILFYFCFIKCSMLNNEYIKTRCHD